MKLRWFARIGPLVASGNLSSLALALGLLALVVFVLLAMLTDGGVPAP